MKTHTYPDGSIQEMYENGDLVELTKKQLGELGAEIGDWGSVILTNSEDKDRGHTSHSSHIAIKTAGVSTPKDSFQQYLPSVPM